MMERGTMKALSLRWLALVLALVVVLAPSRALGQGSLTVTTTADTVDANPGDGQCRDSEGQCSLRAAVMEANALGGSHTIVLQAGQTYNLSRDTDGGGHDVDSGADNDDLDIRADIVIQGNGATIQRDPSLACPSRPDGRPQTGEFRLFQVARNGALSLEDVTLKNGCANAGGWVPTGSGAVIYRDEGVGAVRLTRVLITGNVSGQNLIRLVAVFVVDFNGLTVRDSTIEDNQGDAISILCGPITVANSTIARNSGDGIRSGVGCYRDVIISDSIISDNGGTGIAIGASGPLRITGSTISRNGDGGISMDNSPGFPGQLDIENTVIEENRVGGGSAQGGGIWLDSVTGRLHRVSIVGNHSDNDGGGIHAYGSSLEITDSVISRNTAEDLGGGIVVFGDATNLTITGSEISGNRARYEAAMALVGRGTISDSRVEGNIVTENSAAVGTRQGAWTINNTLISGNSGTGGSGIINGGTLTLNSSTVSDNSADYGGGIINRGTLTISNSTVSGNRVGGAGGGIINRGTLTISNSTVSGNRAGDAGGGIVNTDTGTLTISNSTVSGNTAEGSIGGGGIFNDGVLHASFVTIAGNNGRPGGVLNFGDFAVKNSIVQDCEAGYTGGGPAYANASGVNYVTGQDCGPGFTRVTLAQLNLGPLGNNGGTTETHALLPGSVAIDSVTDCTDLDGHPVATDQRGVSRPQGAGCDAGAYETSGGPVAPGAPSVQVEGGDVVVSWGPVSGASSYNLYMAEEPGVRKDNWQGKVGGMKHEDVSSPFRHPTPLAPGRTYCFVVTAVGPWGESAESPETCVTLPPAPPQGLTATAGDGSVTLVWSPSEGASSYNVYLAEECGLTPENYGSKRGGRRIEGVSRPYTVTGLTNGTSYCFIVTAVNAGGESGPSAEAQATPEGGAPPGPQGCQELVTSEDATVTRCEVVEAPPGAPGGFRPREAVSFTLSDVVGSANVCIRFAEVPASPAVYKVVGGAWHQLYPGDEMEGVANVSLDAAGRRLCFNI